MTKSNRDRRRFIKILGAMPGLLLVSRASNTQANVRTDMTDNNLHVWRGVALGADAMIQLHHPDAATARHLIDKSLMEVARLEHIFSLYDPNSALSRLNRDKSLSGPPLELVELLGRCFDFSETTGGAFDITVQPLWNLYCTHFCQPNADPAGPSREDVAATLMRVGYRSIVLTPDRIDFVRDGAAVTLNGVAQGYLTDCVVDLLRRAGIGQTLVDMGEIRALDGRPRGGPWIVGLEDPATSGHVMRRILLDNRAVSTSGGYGTPLDPAGRFNHIFDPATGATSSRYRSVSVVADSATTADALSTAFSLMPVDAITSIARQLRLNVYLTMPDGSQRTVGTT